MDDVVDPDSLVAQRMSNIQTTGNGSARLHRVVADQPVDYQLPGASRSGVRGWRIDFDAPRAGSATGTAQHPGERSHPRLTAWGDLLIVTTQIPGWGGWWRNRCRRADQVGHRRQSPPSGS